MDWFRGDIQSGYYLKSYKPDQPGSKIMSLNDAFKLQGHGSRYLMYHFCCRDIELFTLALIKHPKLGSKQGKSPAKPRRSCLDSQSKSA